MKNQHNPQRTFLERGGVRTLFAALLAAGALFCGAQNASAQKTQGKEKQEEMVDLSDLSLAENILLPDVNEKQAPFIRNYMNREAQGLKAKGYKVETARNGEVVIASIPADELFAPNDTTLLPGAAKVLEPFLPYFRIYGKFRLVMAMHSDNTGSGDYLLNLTEKRIIALYDFFDSHASQTDMLQGYPMADSEPAADNKDGNSTREGRKANRRLEIYIVPGPMLLMEAKTKKL